MHKGQREQFQHIIIAGDFITMYITSVCRELRQIEKSPKLYCLLE